MGVWQTISLAGVLLLALYGCAQLLMKMSLLCLRPHKPAVHLVVELHSGDAVEQQMRFAEWLSKEQSIPLCVQSNGLTEEEQQILLYLTDGKSC